MQTKDKLSEVYFFPILFVYIWLISSLRVDFVSSRECVYRATDCECANECEQKSGQQTNKPKNPSLSSSSPSPCCSQGRENTKNSPVAFCVAADSDSVPVPSDIWPYRIICLCNFITIYTVLYEIFPTPRRCMCVCVCELTAETAGCINLWIIFDIMYGRTIRLTARMNGVLVNLFF